MPKILAHHFFLPVGLNEKRLTFFQPGERYDFEKIPKAKTEDIQAEAASDKEVEAATEESHAKQEELKEGITPKLVAKDFDVLMGLGSPLTTALDYLAKVPKMRTKDEETGEFFMEYEAIGNQAQSMLSLLLPQSVLANCSWQDFVKGAQLFCNNYGEELEVDGKLGKRTAKALIKVIGGRSGIKPAKIYEFSPTKLAQKNAEAKQEDAQESLATLLEAQRNYAEAQNKLKEARELSSFNPEKKGIVTQAEQNFQEANRALFYAEKNHYENQIGLDSTENELEIITQKGHGFGEDEVAVFEEAFKEAGFTGPTTDVLKDLWIMYQMALEKGKKPNARNLTQEIGTFTLTKQALGRNDMPVAEYMEKVFPIKKAYRDANPDVKDVPRDYIFAEFKKLENPTVVKNADQETKITGETASEGDLEALGGEADRFAEKRDKAEEALNSAKESAKNLADGATFPESDKTVKQVVEEKEKEFTEAEKAYDAAYHKYSVEWARQNKEGAKKELEELENKKEEAEKKFDEAEKKEAMTEEIQAEYDVAYDDYDKAHNAMAEAFPEEYEKNEESAS